MAAMKKMHKEKHNSLLENLQAPAFLAKSLSDENRFTNTAMHQQQEKIGLRNR